jgi:subtilisin family serine protease
MLVHPRTQEAISGTQLSRRVFGLGWGVAALFVAVGVIQSPVGAAPPLPAGDEVVVWVKFTDRGPLEQATAEVRRAAALSRISERSLARRARRGGLAEPLESDLPVHGDYVDALSALGFPVRAVSRWLNAASVVVGPERLAELEALPFVAGTERVPRYRLRPPDDLEPDEGGIAAGAGAEPKRSGSSPSGNAVPPLSPGDPSFYGASHVQNQIIQADALHSRGMSGSGVLITVIDTGFRETHGVFDSLDVLARRDFIHGDEVVSNEPGQDPDPISGDNQESHGTRVLSVLAGNWPGVHMGTAFRTQVALAKTEWVPSETPVEMDYWQMAAEWADSLGADVLTTSLGYSTFDDPADNYSYEDLDGYTTVITLAAVEAARRGITVVTAQGNEGNDPWLRLLAPADADSACAVGSVDSMGVVSFFSSWGPTADGRVKPDVCAMGQAVRMCNVLDDSGFTRGHGTSFSAPAVAGLVALLLEEHPTWGPFEVLEALRRTADRYDTPDSLYGFGIARGELAVDWVPSTVAAAPTAGLGGLDLAGPHPRRGGPIRLRLSMGPAPGPARVDLYDIRGRRLLKLFEEELAAGARRTVSWDGADAMGGKVAAGVYLARFTAPGSQMSRRLVWFP